MNVASTPTVTNRTHGSTEIRGGVYQTGERASLESRSPWYLLASCATLGKLLNLSKLQDFFKTYKMGTTLRSWSCVKFNNPCIMLITGSAHGKHSGSCSCSYYNNNTVTHVNVFCKQINCQMPGLRYFILPPWSCFLIFKKGRDGSFLGLFYLHTSFILHT